MTLLLGLPVGVGGVGAGGVGTVAVGVCGPAPATLIEPCDVDVPPVELTEVTVPGLTDWDPDGVVTVAGPELEATLTVPSAPTLPLTLLPEMEVPLGRVTVTGVPVLEATLTWPEVTDTDTPPDGDEETLKDAPAETLTELPSASVTDSGDGVLIVAPAGMVLPCVTVV